MQILVFPRNETDPVAAPLIKLFEAQGFMPLVDALHGGDINWLRTKFKCPHRLIWHDENMYWDAGTVDQMEIGQHPSLAVFFNERTVLTDFDWEQIGVYFIKLVEGGVIPDRLARHIKKIRDEFVELPIVSDPPAAPALPQYYQFRSKVIEDRDVALFEIIKANSLQPYTTIVRQFSINGYKPVFTNFFAVQSFRNDLLACCFLKKLWEHFEMPGEFDLDEMFKNATEACYPGEDHVPIAEPEVYVRSIEEVLEKLQEKEWGQQ